MERQYRWRAGGRKCSLALADTQRFFLWILPFMRFPLHCQRQNTTGSILWSSPSRQKELYTDNSNWHKTCSTSLSKGVTHTKLLNLININPFFKLAVSREPYMTSHTSYTRVSRYLHILEDYKTVWLFMSLNIIGHVKLQGKSAEHAEIRR